MYHTKAEPYLKHNATRLETLILDVYNQNTGDFEKLRVFLDGGAQMSIISTECAKKCGLKTESSESVMIATFGGHLSKKKLNITTVDCYENPSDYSGKLSVRVYIMDKLVDPIKAYPLSERQEKICLAQNYQLSDELAGKSELLKIDMLVGADCINNFSAGNSIKLPGGSILKKSWDP